MIAQKEYSKKSMRVFVRTHGRGYHSLCPRAILRPWSRDRHVPKYPVDRKPSEVLELHQYAKSMLDKPISVDATWKC